MREMSVTETAVKSKQLCKGCRNDFYNGQGASECWSFKTAEVVTRYKIGWWTRPTEPGAYRKVETLSCHHCPGQYAMHKELPHFVKPEDVR
jgi:hypothetical protein